MDWVLVDVCTKTLIDIGGGLSPRSAVDKSMVWLAAVACSTRADISEPPVSDGMCLCAFLRLVISDGLLSSIPRLSAPDLIMVRNQCTA